jgi:hypothetical protein
MWYQPMPKLCLIGMARRAYRTGHQIGTGSGQVAFASRQADASGPGPSLVIHRAASASPIRPLRTPSRRVIAPCYGERVAALLGVDGGTAGRGGDSGGPVFTLDGSGVRAKGIVSAGGGNTTLVARTRIAAQ